MAWEIQEIHTIKQSCWNFWSCVNPSKTKQPTEGWRQVLASQTLNSLFLRDVFEVTILIFSKKDLGCSPSGEDVRGKSRVEKVCPCNVMSNWSHCSIVFTWHCCFHGSCEKGPGPLSRNPKLIHITNDVSFILPNIHWKRAAVTGTRKTLLPLHVCSHTIAQSKVNRGAGGRAEEQTDTVGQQMVAQLVLTTWICFLKSLWESGTLRVSQACQPEFFKRGAVQKELMTPCQVRRWWTNPEQRMQRDADSGDLISTKTRVKGVHHCILPSHG